MSQPTFEVGSASLLTGHAQYVEQVRQEIMAQLQTLISELEPLSGHWQGTAAVAFARLKNAYTSRQVGIDKVLADISEALRGGQTIAHAADTTAQEAIARIARATFTTTSGKRP